MGTKKGKLFRNNECDYLEIETNTKQEQEQEKSTWIRPLLLYGFNSLQQTMNLIFHFAFHV